MEWDEIISYFFSIGLLTDPANKPKDFDGLHEALLSFPFGSADIPNRLIRFDAECIETEDAYAKLYQRFLHAFSSELPIEIVSSHVDADKGSAKIEIKKRGKLIEAEWKQDSDWVAKEFLEFVFTSTKNRDESLFAIDTGDQTLQYVCISNKVSSELKKAKSKSQKTRINHFISYFGSGGPAYSYNYYSKEDYNEVIRQFKNHFLTQDSYEIDSFKPPVTDLYCSTFLLDSSDEQRSKLFEDIKTHHMTPNVAYYTSVAAYDIPQILPDEPAIVFTQDPAFSIAYEENGKAAMQIYHHNSKDIIPILIVMAKDYSWAVILNFQSVINRSCYVILQGSCVKNLENVDNIKQTIVR